MQSACCSEQEKNGSLVRGGSFSCSFLDLPVLTLQLELILADPINLDEGEGEILADDPDVAFGVAILSLFFALIVGNLAKKVSRED